MLLPIVILVLSSTHASSSALVPPQTPFIAPLAPRALTGRWMHLTDLHPDPFYKSGTDEDEACHFERKKKKHKKRKGKGKGVGISNEVGIGLNGETGGFEDDDDDEEDAMNVLGKDGSRTAGYWGLPVSDCDSPLSLINATFDWLETNFKGEVDFVVWTGDNARHDIDTRLPRSMPEIFDLNTYILDRMQQAFGEDTVLISSIGNNDIYPHNIMFGPGPTKITTTFGRIWSHLIPEHHAHTFARGGYYSSSAHPSLKDDLLLISLNTLYFYDRNSVVDGCPPFEDDFSSALATTLLGSKTSSLPHPSSPEAAHLFASTVASLPASIKGDLDPGTEQLLWLEQQLLLAKAKGMQVLITGHVPASKGNWYEGCWGRYSELIGEYGGTVLGQLFGHMNVDHFSFITPADSKKPSTPSIAPTSPASPSLLSRIMSSISSSASSSSALIDEPVSELNLPEDLFSLFSSLPSHPERHNLDGYSVQHINPSVIPTYTPGVRVWEYNTTRAEEGREEDDEEDEEAEEEGWKAWLKGKGKKGKKGKGKKRKQKKPKEGKKKNELFGAAPSRHNTFLTPLSFTQYYLPPSVLETANRLYLSALSTNSTPRPPAWEIEYTTLTSSAVASRLLHPSALSPNAPSDPLFLPATLPQPVSSLLSLPPSASRTHDLRRLLKQLKLTPFDSLGAVEGEGLVLSSWIRAAKKSVEGGRDGKEWKAMRGRMGVGTGAV